MEPDPPPPPPFQELDAEIQLHDTTVLSENAAITNTNVTLPRPILPHNEGAADSDAKELLVSPPPVFDDISVDPPVSGAVEAVNSTAGDRASTYTTRTAESAMSHTILDDKSAPVAEPSLEDDHVRVRFLYVPGSDGQKQVSLMMTFEKPKPAPKPKPKVKVQFPEKISDCTSEPTLRIQFIPSVGLGVDKMNVFILIDDPDDITFVAGAGLNQVQLAAKYNNRISENSLLKQEASLIQVHLAQVDVVLAGVVAGVCTDHGESVFPEDFLFEWPSYMEDHTMAANLAAQKVQSVFRGHRVRDRLAKEAMARAKKAKQEHKAAVIIQSQARVKLARNEVARQRFSQQIVIKWVHGWVVRMRFKAQMNILLRNQSATKIQAMCRGAICRHRVMEMRKLNSVCICGRSAYGEMIMCADCFQFFHFRCMEKMGISMPTSKKMIVPFLKNGWRCPDCDTKGMAAPRGRAGVAQPEPTCVVRPRQVVPMSASLVRIHTEDDEDLQRLLSVEPELSVSHAPKHLWPGDAQQQPRKLDPLDTQGLTDEAVERLKAIDHVRGRLVRHQRRYDRMVGQLLTRMQSLPVDFELEKPMTPGDLQRPRFNPSTKPSWSHGTRKWIKKKEFEQAERRRIKEEQRRLRAEQRRLNDEALSEVNEDGFEFSQSALTLSSDRESPHTVSDKEPKSPTKEKKGKAIPAGKKDKGNTPRKKV
eukprot:CAMPEP_0114241486 /NCGR_PEP_ID=MMETSP0058-20121206/9655_1 /TAXON_ID=36894 /ORGANISM="Pyramimonas parkeae, CCMP726" /LENGTH=702 /DNA_ID=CAMNT_0001354009 /DNA_START=308 /DNA_END=2416 /DNA_ORIENTATION=-